MVLVDVWVWLVAVPVSVEVTFRVTSSVYAPLVRLPSRSVVVVVVEEPVAVVESVWLAELCSVVTDRVEVVVLSYVSNRVFPVSSVVELTVSVWAVVVTVRLWFSVNPVAVEVDETID